MNRPAAPPLPDDLLVAVGATRSTAPALEQLVRRHRRRRLLTLRALLDEVRAAPPGLLPAGGAEPPLRHWELLERAERADPGAARLVVHYPMTGVWAERTLRALVNRRPPPAAGLEHLAALAAAAAARSGLRFRVELTSYQGVFALPTLGAYRPSPDREPPQSSGRIPRATLEGEPGRLRLRLPEPRPRSCPPAVEIRRGPDGVWRSAAPGWHPLRLLTAPGGPSVLVDDADPYRDEERTTNPYGLTAVDTLDGAQHALWRTAWHDAQHWLSLGGGVRAREVAALLNCLVPLGGSATIRCSATRDEAFGALLCSTPRGGLELAATLVHELQHAKLLTLAEATALHTADGDPRYWAPWRPDPRPFDGLFQGAYAHLALADFHLGVALGAGALSVRESAWADHCRCRQQVEAALPQLLGSSRLTPSGLTLVKAMAAHHVRLKQHRPPPGHLARAASYVDTSRAMWRRHRLRPA